MGRIPQDLRRHTLVMRFSVQADVDSKTIGRRVLLVFLHCSAAADSGLHGRQFSQTRHG